MNLEMASGYYLNVYNTNRIDIFVIFNEPNDMPTPDELDAAAILVENELKKDPSCKHLQEVLEESDLSCCAYGVQVVMKNM